MERCQEKTDLPGAKMRRAFLANFAKEGAAEAAEGGEESPEAKAGDRKNFRIFRKRGKILKFFQPGGPVF